MDIVEVTAFLNTDEGKALVETHEATNGLRIKKDELLSANTVMKNQLAAYTALGDPATIAAAISAAKVAPTNIDPDPAAAAQLAHLQKELDTERGTRTAREAALVNSFVSGEVVSAISQSKGEPLLLKPIVSARVKGTLNEDGTISIEVLNADGTPMFKNGKAATVADLIEEIKADKVYGRAFDPDETSGSGTRQSAQKTQQKVEGKTLTEIMAAQKRKGA